jgi:4-hydroxy-3-methylbut-2-enyl diphosphate reductase
MKLILSEPRGFCAGVVRAIETVEKALIKWGAPIYVKHEIVHNKHVVEGLKAKGAIFIEDLSEVPPGSRLVYSAHGIAPHVRVQAQARGLIEIDATCGLVTKVHSAVSRYAKKGYTIFLIGHKNHVEVQGTYGEAPDQTYIIETLADVEALEVPATEKVFYVTQTTLSLLDIHSIVEALLKKFPQIESLPSSSICYATTNRQEALMAIAARCDLVLVVGDLTSSNSNRLVEVAKSFHIPAYLINAPCDIQSDWLKGVSNIGLTAGASSPENVVEACIQRLQALGVTEIEKATYVKEDVVFQLPRILTA